MSGISRFVAFGGSQGPQGPAGPAGAGTRATRVLVPITDGATPTVLTTDQGAGGTLQFSGSLSAARVAQPPLVDGTTWNAYNSTNKPILVQGPTGAGVTLMPGARKKLASDGSGVYNAAPGPHFDPTDYGAIGDGVANDTAAVQAAYNAAMAAGRKTYFPAGTYLVDTILLRNVAPTANFYGDGKYKSILKSRTGAAIFEITGGVSTPQGISISNMWLQGLAVLPTLAWAGTAPPAVTLSGSSALPVNVRIEVTTGGANPVVRYSLDGGGPLGTYRSGLSVAGGGTLALLDGSGVASGVTAMFPVGSYASDNVYTSVFPTNCHGIYSHDVISSTGNPPFSVFLRDLFITGWSGHGIFLKEHYFTLIEGVEVDNCNLNLFECQGNNTLTLISCYAHNILTAGQAGFRFYSGQVTMIGCNGIDQSVGGDWAVLGQDPAQDAGAGPNYVRLTLQGCNIEDFKNRGIALRTGSHVDVFGVSFLSTLDITTTLGTNPPAVTITGQAGTPQVTTMSNVRIEITTGGGPPVAMARISINGGATWTTPASIAGFTLPIGNGCTANFPNSTYAADNVWIATSGSRAIAYDSTDPDNGMSTFSGSSSMGTKGASYLFGESVHGQAGSTAPIVSYTSTLNSFYCVANSGSASIPRWRMLYRYDASGATPGGKSTLRVNGLAVDDQIVYPPVGASAGLIAPRIGFAGQPSTNQGGYGAGSKLFNDESNGTPVGVTEYWTALAEGVPPLWVPSGGANTPLGNVYGLPGQTFRRSDGAAGTTFYVKESGGMVTTIAAGVPLGAATIAVASLVGAPASGIAWINAQPISYTGVSGSTLTGCTGGSGTSSAGRVVIADKTGWVGK